MNFNDTEDYRAYNSNRKRRLTFSIYLVMLGIIIGALLTNYIRPVNEEKGRVRTDARKPEIAAVSRTDKVVEPDTSAIPVVRTSLRPVSVNETGMYPEFEEAVIAATEHAMPAVVSIHVTGMQLVYYSFRDPVLRMLYGKQMQRKPINGMGSGVIIDPEGIVITNDHVINITNEENIDFEKANITIKVVLYDGRTFEAKVIKHFPVQDIAILSIEGDNLPYLEIGASSDLRQGQSVLAIGNPFGDALTGGLLGGEPTVTRGIISATKRTLSIPADNFTRYYRNMLQTDASINEGNSGGALVDLRGKLVGINTAIMSPGGTGSIGIGFAFPADRVNLIMENLEEYGDVRQWYTGIKVQELTPALARSLDYEGTGVLIADTEKDSPGEESGLVQGDIIVKVDGFTVTTPKEIVNVFQGALPGETIMLTIVRNGKYKDTQLKVGAYE